MEKKKYKYKKNKKNKKIQKQKYNKTQKQKYKKIQKYKKGNMGGEKAALLLRTERNFRVS